MALPRRISQTWSSASLCCRGFSSLVASESNDFAASVTRVACWINGKHLTVPQGTTILDAAKKNSFFVPTLCTDPRLPGHPGTCRLCLVDVEGRGLVPSCSTEIEDGMKIETDSDKVNSSVRSMLNMLKQSHKYDCMTCDVSGHCEFQDLIKRYNVSGGVIPKLRMHEHEWDDEFRGSRSLEIDLDKCIKCGRCISACNIIQKMNVLGWQGRGGEMHPGVMKQTLDSSPCIECGQCSLVCPVGAITEHSEWREVLDKLESKRQVMVAMCAPSVRVSIGEEVGLGPGVITEGQMIEALRELGFDHVLDVNAGADLTVMEESKELVDRISNGGPLPLFTSCCPAWVTLIEKSYPELIPNLSSCKSPQQMLGSIVKRYFASKLGKKPEEVCLVSFMPCTAKKTESQRPGNVVDDGQNIVDVDHVLTTREFGLLLHYHHVPLGSLRDSSFDSPLGQSSGGGNLFGASGGVMESTLRTAYELATKKPLPRLELEEIRGIRGIKTATITIPDDSEFIAGKILNVAVVNGIGNVRKLLENIQNEDHAYDFVEVMACRGGCIGGGGQPKTRDASAVLKRMGSIYAIDKASKIRKAHENPDVQALYKEYLGSVASQRAHSLLHTRYSKKHS